MSEVFVGNSIVGNFSPKNDLSYNFSQYKLEKISGVLRMVNDMESIELIPIDDQSKLVVSNFSTEIGEFNESIYKLENSNGIIVVILYVYNAVQKLLGESQKIHIHLRREAEKQICDEGYGDFQLSSMDEIVPFFTDMFINNRSIFVHLESKNQTGFQMFGKKYRANVKMERPGVYVIDRIYKTYNKDFSFSLTQIYGNIDFIKWSDSTSIEGNPATRLEAVKTNEVFKAWNEYMDFERQIYENNLHDQGVLKYSKIIAKDEKLIFETESDISACSKGGEFEFYSAFSYDGERALPDNVEDLLSLKHDPKNSSVFLGKCLNEEMTGNEMVFTLPFKGFSMEMCKHKGLLYVSDHSLQVEQRRRKKVLQQIESKKNESSNIIMKLSSNDVIDDQVASSFKPINAEVLKKMFGNPTFEVKETFREAMSIALNTPDIALIQGPPGTGKTTLIAGIIARLNMMNKNYKILVSSEQHEALYNVVGKLSTNKLIPPFVSSKQFGVDDDDEERLEDNIKEFQQSFLALCNDLLRDQKGKPLRSKKITEVIYLLQQIRDNNYSKNYISSIIDNLKEKLIDLGIFDRVSVYTNRLEVTSKLSGSKTNEEPDFVTKAIIRKIESQRTDIDVFIDDDGQRQLNDLQKLLKNNGYDEFLLPEKEYLELASGNNESISKTFQSYIAYVDGLKLRFIPREFNEFEDVPQNVNDAKSNIEAIYEEVYKLSKEGPKSFLDIVESLAFRLIDIDSATEVVKEYTSVVGSTCAQADKSLDVVELTNSRYDYVIIDEAARANPLDIMIPMMLGTKVLLIGDHKQLPHYIESNYVNLFKGEKERYSGFDEELLTKSLFQIIYENLDAAYKEGRIKCRRTIQIDEQHRMNPVIGQFISKEFYNGTISDGEKTVNKINDYNICNKKNIAWINVPVFKGMEDPVEQSLKRDAEVDRIKKLLKDIVSKNSGRNLNIGIISFYKGQVNEINAMLKDNFPLDVLEGISCNTVDSYQGKEFDIVIVSGVRSNNYTSPERSLGFIHHSASRINVALSRAKKLLIMVADEDTYKKNEHFQHFIGYVKENGYYEQ